LSAGSCWWWPEAGAGGDDTARRPSGRAVVSFSDFRSAAAYGLRRCRAYGYIRASVPAAAIKTLLVSLAYVFLLIAALVIVNIVLTRLTREEREAERQRRRKSS
jgi:hypothetical protein